MPIFTIPSASSRASSLVSFEQQGKGSEIILLLNILAILSWISVCNHLLRPWKNLKRGLRVVAGSAVNMSSRPLQATKVYRDLLKAIKKHIGKEEYKRHFGDYVVQEFRKNCTLVDPSAIQQKIKLAHDYTFLLNSVHHHKDLLLSYNIAVDRSDEMRRVLGKSAASVGLQLPDVYQA